MKKNGFTFAELIAVIVIMSILSLIAIPTIEKIIKENKKNIYQKQLDNIVLVFKNWASDYKEFLPENDGDILTLTLDQLKSDGYMEYETKNPNTNKCFDNNMMLKVQKSKKNYSYSIVKDTIKETEDCEFDINKPSILLKGNVVEKVEVNSIFIDKGVIALNQEGDDISASVSTTITGSGNVVDASVIGNKYVITYTVTYNGKNSSVSRNLEVVDTTAPELIIPGNTTISKTAISFDALNGVSVTDNSGEEITPVIKSNISFGIPGKYEITYTATDSSGNQSIKKRIIVISNE